MNDLKKNKVQHKIIAKKSNKGSSHNLPKITSSTTTPFKLHKEDNINVTNLLTDPSSNILNTSESNNSTQNNKFKLEKISTAKKNSFQQNSIIKLNPSVKLDIPTTLKSYSKKKDGMDIKTFSTTAKVLPKSTKNAQNKKFSLTSNKTTTIKRQNLNNVILKTDSPAKSNNILKEPSIKSRLRNNSNSYSIKFLKTLNQTKDSKECNINNNTIYDKENDLNEFNKFYSPYLTDHSGDLKSSNKMKSNFKSLLTSFNTELSLSNEQSISPDKNKNHFNIDHNEMTFPNKNLLNLINKLKIILNEGNNEDSSFFTKKINFNQTNNKEELDRELKRNMLFFEIDNIMREAKELHKDIKNNNKQYENNNRLNDINRSGGMFRHSSNDLNHNTSSSTNTVKTNSERRTMIYRKFFEVCGEAMNEIKNVLIGGINFINIVENKTIITINNNESTKIENNTNNITNAVYNNSNTNSSNKVNLNLNLNVKTINQITERDNNPNTLRKTVKRKSRKNTTNNRNNIKNINYDNDDCYDDSMFSEDVEINLPQRVFLVKKPKEDKYTSYKLYTEGDAYEDLSQNDENNFLNNISYTSSDDDTIRMYTEYSPDLRNKKLRSKSLLQVTNKVKAFDLKEDRSVTKTKKMDGFPFIGIFNDITIDKLNNKANENRIDSVFSESDDIAAGCVNIGY